MSLFHLKICCPLHLFSYSLWLTSLFHLKSKNMLLSLCFHTACGWHVTFSPKNMLPSPSVFIQFVTGTSLFHLKLCCRLHLSSYSLCQACHLSTKNLLPSPSVFIQLVAGSSLFQLKICCCPHLFSYSLWLWHVTFPPETCCHPQLASYSLWLTCHFSTKNVLPIPIWLHTAYI